MSEGLKSVPRIQPRVLSCVNNTFPSDDMKLSGGSIVLATLFAALPVLAAPYPAGTRDVADTLIDDLSALNVSKVVSNEDDLNDEDDELDDELDDEGLLDDYSYLDEVLDRSKAVSRGPNNPIDVTLDCRGIEELCDANCYAILCLNRPRLL